MTADAMAELVTFLNKILLLPATDKDAQVVSTSEGDTLGTETKTLDFRPLFCFVFFPQLIPFKDVI